MWQQARYSYLITAHQKIVNPILGGEQEVTRCLTGLASSRDGFIKVLDCGREDVGELKIEARGIGRLEGAGLIVEKVTATALAHKKRSECDRLLHSDDVDIHPWLASSLA
jgi:hypothetical protein